MLCFQILDFCKDEGQPTENYLPGEIFVNNFQITISLQTDSSSAWRKVIKSSYQNVIIGAQKTTTNLNMKGTKGGGGSIQLCPNFQPYLGLGVRHVVYWNLNADAGSQALKVNLIVYDNDTLQVKTN